MPNRNAVFATALNSVGVESKMGCHVIDSFGFAEDITVNKNFKLSIFPVYITRITDHASVDTLSAEAAARQQARKKLRAAKM